MSHTPPVDSRGAAIDDVLRQFRQHLVHGIMSDTPRQMTFDEALEAILALLAQEVNKTDKVTRFEVVDHSKDFKGRCYSKWDCQVELSYQDDGRTLKVFVTDRKAGLV